MENYIVRIYRRDLDDPDRVAGMLESVEKQTRHPFNTLMDLHSLLSEERTSSAPPKIKTMSAAE